MTKIGIYCPNWLLSWHNTDHKIVKMFSRLDEFSDLELDFAASASYTLSFNANRFLQRLLSNAPQMLKYSLNKNAESDLIYHYGTPASPSCFYKMVSNAPNFITTGFMTDRYMENAFGKVVDRQQEADDLAKSMEHASMIHFHTEGGRSRFLQYRPEFEKKAVSIPFFLPNIEASKRIHNADSNDTQSVKILFVGNEGARKGLHELMDALDFLGSEYLNKFKVELTVVSKDKPQPKCNYPIMWHKKLPHKEVIKEMEKSSIFVLVPKNESYGLVLIEAMNSGCAVITDDEDTRKEIVGDAGILLPSLSIESIAFGLQTLIEDEQHRTLLGQRAQKRIKNNFLPNVVAKQYEDTFKSLADNKPI